MKSPKTGNSMGSKAIKAQIDENIKRVYQSSLEEDVPDRFAALLAQLRAKEEKAE